MVLKKRIKPPLKGEDGASRRRGFRRYAEYHYGNPRRIRTIPCCPPWGKCREAAKGVALVTLSCYHSTSHTPSVSPFGLPAPPLGSQGGWGEFAQGFSKPQVPAAKPLSQAPWACQLPFQGRFFSLPPLGVVLRAANQDSNDCRWQSCLCFVPRSGKGGAVGNFELLPFNERHPLSLALLDSSPIGEPRASLPPLGEVPRSGKGGVVGHFELLPFIEQHPLSLALLDSSPIGEPRVLNIEGGFMK